MQIWAEPGKIGPAHSQLFTNLISVFNVYTKLETVSLVQKLMRTMIKDLPRKILGRSFSISYLVSLLDSLRDNSLFCYSVSLVGPVGVNVLTVNYLVSSNFVVVSSTLLQTLSVLVSLLLSCECFLVALGVLS